MDSEIISVNFCENKRLNIDAEPIHKNPKE